VPQEVKKAVNELCYTSGYIISIGINKPELNSDALWFYVYDKDMPFSRVNFPYKKSPHNVPMGCSSLQAEIFFSNKLLLPDKNETLKKTIDGLTKIGIITQNEIIFSDIRYEKYANVIFDLNIYKNRKTILEFLNSKGIITAGRFGRWEYYWTDQAFMDGRRAAEELTD
jgi:protoporphyrinogen oxidase